ncbi:MAG: peptide chain release factor N(5)-glutamine methyltransferase [Hyphomonadaceae bacterium]
MSETLVSAWQDARKALEAAGVDEPTIDARLLVELGAGVKRIDILTEPRRALSATQSAAIAALVARRAAREPMSHILGRKGFRTIELAVNAAVLTPRADTEVLAHAALEAIGLDQPARVLDLGVGSGAVLAAILTERPLASGVGVDVSAEALAVAARNIAALGLAGRTELRAGDWCAGLAEQFDIVAANPPYIPSGDIAALAPEVARYEPRLALDGGADGLDAYRAIAPHLPALLKPGGLAAFEFGVGQNEAVRDILAKAGLRPVTLWRDLEGRARVWTARAEKILGSAG